MLIETPQIQDYQLIDSGNGRRLERFGKYILIRPDPQAIWQPKADNGVWSAADAVFLESEQKGERGNWQVKKEMPEKWLMHYSDLAYWVRLTPFKHTGVFPEQTTQWSWIEEKLKNHTESFKNESTEENKKVNILNLFAYTGIASLVCAKNGAAVTHVDASKPTIGWARENQKASGLDNKPIRWILDDAAKFIQREIKRNVRYDGIIMDPPVYGHGPTGERWNFYEDFPRLLELCKDVLSEKPLFIIINAYAISASSIMLENMLNDLNLKGQLESGELALKEETASRLLSTGIFARWSKI